MSGAINNEENIITKPVDSLSSYVCQKCGTLSVDRQFLRVGEHYICEHCFLDAHKTRASLIQDVYEQFVESLAEALDLREKETGLHSKRVAAFTLLLAQHFYSDPQSLRDIYWGSLLHDIGKIGVPDNILLKPDRLSEEEWLIMREHPANGRNILKHLPFLAMAGEIVLCHEERFDGSGYPAGLKGEAIPLPARLFAVIDTLDAMTFDRSYRKALPFDVAKAEILRMSGSQFDPVAVETFLKEENALRQALALQYPGAKSSLG